MQEPSRRLLLVALLRLSFPGSQVCVRLRHADLPPARRASGARLCAELGHQLRHQRRSRVEGARRLLTSIFRVLSHASPAVTQEILTEALKAVVIVVILERLHLTRPMPWLEQHLDYLCLQARIFGDTTLSFTEQIGVFWRNTRRLSS